MPQVGPRMTDSAAVQGSQPWCQGGSGDARLAARWRRELLVCEPQSLLLGHRPGCAASTDMSDKARLAPCQLAAVQRQTENAHALKEFGIIREETPVARTAATCAQWNQGRCPGRRTPG